MVSRVFYNPYFDKYYTLKDCYLSVEDAFTKKTAAILRRNGYHTVLDLVHQGPRMVNDIRMIGEKTFSEISNVLSALGMTDWKVLPITYIHDRNRYVDQYYSFETIIRKEYGAL